MESMYGLVVTQVTARGMLETVGVFGGIISLWSGGSLFSILQLVFYALLALLYTLKQHVRQSDVIVMSK